VGAQAMITSNDAEEIIAECKNKKDPAIYLEIYVKHLCRWIEIQDERIEWHKEQLNQIYKDTK
jgi:hypothetical protein